MEKGKRNSVLVEKRPPDCGNATPMMLVNEIARVSRGVVRSKEGNMPESYRQLLFHLAMKDGRTQLELVHATRFKAPTVSVTLQKLEQEGYVIRKPDEKDLRQVRVYLTEKGRRHDDDIKEALKLLDEKVMKDFSEKEIRYLKELLTRMRNNIFDGERPPRPAPEKQ